jgi:hypothetical protein
MAIGMVVSSLTAAANPGDTTIAVAATTNLRPGMGIIIGNREWNIVSNTYTGSTTVPIDGQVKANHLSGAPVQWDGNLEPGLTGS